MLPEAKRIVPDPPRVDPQERESLDVWGFSDTRFRARPDGVVELTGSRYALCGQELRDLLPWVQRTIHPDVSPENLNPAHYPPPIPEARQHPAFTDEIGKALGQDAVVTDPEIRLRHGHGHTQEEMYAIKYERLERVPDCVAYPQSDEQVVALVEAARRHDVCLVPYGGGTNVSEALRCPQADARFLVSVDMSRMNRILWIDPVNHSAHIQAGAVGRHLVAQLAHYGFTLGHEPDSIEFSTLGGWIATHASGMKKNRYGNIEELVLDATVVTARGVLERSSAAPRESIGVLDARRWMFGSEGSFGIITSAVVKIFPLPERKLYGSVLFPNFESGVGFLYALTRGGSRPASVRLADNLQFQLSQTLKARRRGAKKWIGMLERWFVTRLKGFRPERMTACTLVFEGSRQEVAEQQKSVYRTAKLFGGLESGAANGERGYQLTFGIAYLRDWVMNHFILGESFETSVSWSELLPLCENVKRRIHEECAQRGVPGTPFVTCRVTQTYETGVCVYFYFAFYFKGVDRPSHVFAEIERAARDEVLRSGGSLSHHHGIGKIRRDFLPRIASPGALEWARSIKSAVDPTNIFGAGNQGFADGSSAREIE